jgi:hypothetical protein
MRLALLVALVAAPAVAQEPLRFRFTQGQPLTYSVEQSTAVTETTVEEGKPVLTATATKLTLTRRWNPTAVAADGTATLEMTLLGLRQSITRPGPRDREGKPTTDTVVVDSATAEGKVELAPVVGKPILTLKLDPLGRLLDAKSATPGVAARLAVELPFRVTLPAALPAAGGSWERPITIKLDPPQGTGEEFAATATVTYKGESAGFAVLGLKTELKAPPKDPAVLVGLLPVLWEGDVYIQRATGRYAGSRLSIKREVADHAGPGTKFTYETTFTEALAEK